MRSTIAACAILVLLIGTADAEQCPPGALGVSRTLVVDPNEHSRVGSMQYPETLPLNDHEVVLTFDDGPLPRYTNRVLETLASECVKATFFMVGQMARAYPWMVRRVYDEGHTVANHTQNHPVRKMSVTQAAREIEEGFASLREAIGKCAHCAKEYLAAVGRSPSRNESLSPEWLAKSERTDFGGRQGCRLGQRHLRRRRPADWRSSSASSPGRPIAGRLGDLFSRRSGRRARRPK
jgi:peptidoglycan/xylan/chitin deacetylase (PgdA/CDA1 family)